MKFRTDFVTNSSSTSYFFSEIQYRDESSDILFETEDIYSDSFHLDQTENGVEFCGYKIKTYIDLLACIFFRDAGDYLNADSVPIIIALFSFLAGKITFKKMSQKIKRIISTHEDELDDDLVSELEDMLELDEEDYDEEELIDEIKEKVDEIFSGEFFELDEQETLLELAKEDHDLSDIDYLTLQETNYDRGEFLNKYIDNIRGYTEKYNPFPKIKKDDLLYEKEANKWRYLIPIIMFEPYNSLSSSMDFQFSIDEKCLEEAFSKGDPFYLFPDTSIQSGEYNFYYFRGVKNKLIVDNTEEIRSYRYEHMSDLHSVVLPQGLKIIHAGAFQNCQYLKSINIPDTVTELGNFVFDGCDSLQKLEIPPSVQKIGITCRKDVLTYAIEHKILSYEECDLYYTLELCIEKKYTETIEILAKAGLIPEVFENFPTVDLIQMAVLADSNKILKLFYNAGMKPERGDYTQFIDLAAKKKKIKALEWLKKDNKNSSPESELSEKFIEIKEQLLDDELHQFEGEFNEITNELTLIFESMGTLYEGRTENIESVNVDDPIQIVRDKKNKYNSNNFRLLTEQGKDVGNMPAEICNLLAPLYDNGELKFTSAKANYVEPLSKRGKRCRKGILFVKIQCSLVLTGQSVSQEPIEETIKVLETTTTTNEENKNIEDKITALNHENELTSSNLEYKYIIPAPLIVSAENNISSQNSVIDENDNFSQKTVSDQNVEEIYQEQKPVEKTEIKDPSLALAVQRTFAKLEELYPEHKVFALDSIDKGLRAKITDLYKRIGYESDNDMLQAYGFEFISGDAVKAVRDHVEYMPGNEPDIIKSKVESMLRRLEETYPGHVISGTLQREHKNLAGAVSGLYQWFGYPDASAMLKAYGYQYTQPFIGQRPSNNYEEILQTLFEKYKTAKKPNNMAELIRDNPDLKGPLKSLQNNQYSILGMNAGDYMKKVGIIASDLDPSQFPERIVLNASTQEAPQPKKINEDSNAVSIETNIYNSEISSQNEERTDENEQEKKRRNESGEISNDFLNKQIISPEDEFYTSANNTSKQTTEDIQNESFDDKLIKLALAPLEEFWDDIRIDEPTESIYLYPKKFTDNKNTSGSFISSEQIVTNVLSDVNLKNSSEEQPSISDYDESGSDSESNSDFSKSSDFYEMEISVPENIREQAEIIEESSVHSEKSTDVPDEILSGENNQKRTDQNHERFIDRPSAHEMEVNQLDPKTAWIQYQAYEVLSSGRASAYYFFDLRNEMNLGNYNWQSEEFLYFYMKYFPGMPIEQLHQLRTQAVPRLNEPNTCNAQYQIIMQDSFEHRYVMIAYAWFERAGSFITPAARAQSVFNACRAFFYPQEQQTVWQRLCYEDGLLTNN